jgi:lysophospholipase L1-like esterase
MLSKKTPFAILAFTLALSAFATAQDQPQPPKVNANNDCLVAEAAGGNPAANPTPHPEKIGWQERIDAKHLEGEKSHSQIVFLGDSITRNWDLNRQDALERMLPIFNAFYADRIPLNLGISADTTSNVLWRIDHGAFDGLDPRVIVVLIGTNNSLRCRWSTEQTQGGIDKVVDDLHAHVSKAKILLQAVLPKEAPPEVQDADRTTNRYLAAHYAKSSFVTFVDVNYIFLKDGQIDASLYMDPALKPGAHAVHPGPEAGSRMLQALEPTVAKLYGDKEKHIVALTPPVPAPVSAH